MKKIQILFFASILLFSCNSNSETSNTEDNKTSSDANTEEICTYNINSNELTFEWTAFKTSEKIGVKGSFDVIDVSTTTANKSIPQMLLNTTLQIRTKSINSGNEERDNKLVADFQFENFVSAFAFMTKVAIVAEKFDHHPFWTNVYNKVTIELSTHDAGNVVTDKDHHLASEIDKLI